MSYPLHQRNLVSIEVTVSNIFGIDTWNMSLVWGYQVMSSHMHCTMFKSQKSVLRQLAFLERDNSQNVFQMWSIVSLQCLNFLRKLVDLLSSCHLLSLSLLQLCVYWTVWIFWLHYTPWQYSCVCGLLLAKMSCAAHSCILLLSLETSRVLSHNLHIHVFNMVLQFLTPLIPLISCLLNWVC